jgi:hypothetical protein
MYEYTIATDTSDGTADIGLLNAECQAAGLTIDQITEKQGIIHIFSSDPKASVDPIVAAHSSQALKYHIKGVVREAINFFDELMIDYAADNVALGITQAGKTKSVADYLSNVMRYGQSGSLYEVINEIDSLKAAGVPVDLAPFITDARLDQFKQSILDYLS